LILSPEEITVICVQLKSSGQNIKVKVTDEMAISFLDDDSKLRTVDKSNMISYCLYFSRHFTESEKKARKISLTFPEPDNIIVAGMGGSAIGGELLKDWARDKTPVPIEVNRDYDLPVYANRKTLVVIVSYSGETEESLGAFLDAVKRKSMIYCISSGGSLLEFAEKLSIPYLRVPSGMPPRAALPYMFVPLLLLLEKMKLVSRVSEELSEATKLLIRISEDNSPGKIVENNFSKTLAVGISESVPVVYSFGVYRGVAQRFKQQFNENSKVPSKWEYFSELNHNEIVGWEGAGKLAQGFSTIFIRDKDEPDAIRARIEATKNLMPSRMKKFEIWTQGTGSLGKMLSTILIGDFASVYLAVLRGVDPTPVKTINMLKEKMKQVEMRDKIIGELSKLAE
jgi:glucose/mannose-6-phosphate isomerase